MQEWSGPGPFDSAGNVLITACGLPANVSVQTVTKNGPCLFLDARTLKPKNDHDDPENFPIKVTTTFVDAGPTWRLRKVPAIEVGFGAGFMMAQGDKVAVRPTITAGRGVVKPVLAVAQLCLLTQFWICKKNSSSLFPETNDAKELWKTRWLHTLKFYARENVILGRLNGEDLGASNTTYDRKNEFVGSYGFLVDLGELFPQLSGTR